MKNRSPRKLVASSCLTSSRKWFIRFYVSTILFPQSTRSGVASFCLKVSIRYLHVPEISVIICFITFPILFYKVRVLLNLYRPYVCRLTPLFATHACSITVLIQRVFSSYTTCVYVCTTQVLLVHDLA